MFRVVGKNINLRIVNIKDAKFILSLRAETDKNKYLSKVDSNIESQQSWIKDYKKREDLKQEYYFVIENKKQEDIGLVRIYDLRKESFCWGSWVIKSSAPRTAAIESALQIYEFGFETLNYAQSHFEVHKENKKVVKFHLQFGAKIIKEDEVNYYFIYKKSSHQKTKIKYKKFL